MSPFPWEDDVVQVERGPEPGGMGGAYRGYEEEDVLEPHGRAATPPRA